MVACKRWRIVAKLARGFFALGKTGLESGVIDGFYFDDSVCYK